MSDRKSAGSARARARGDGKRDADKRDRDKQATRRIADLLGRGKQGEAMARALVKKGITTRAALRKPDVIRTLPKDSQLNVMYPPARNTRLAEADELVDELTRRMVFCPARSCFRLPLYVVGSIRRRAPVVKDVDILVHIPARAAKAADAILNSVRLTGSKPGDRATILESHIGGDRHRSSIVRWSHIDEGYRDKRPAPKYFRVDLFLVIGNELPFAMFHYTGSKDYNIRTRALAKRNGYMLNQYGIFDRKTGAPAKGSEKIKTEHDITDFLGITYREPADRNR